MRHSGEICWSLWILQWESGQKSGCLVLLGPPVPLDSLGGEATSVLSDVGTLPFFWAGGVPSSKLACSFPRVPALRRTWWLLGHAGWAQEVSPGRRGRWRTGSGGWDLEVLQPVREEGVGGHWITPLLWQGQKGSRNPGCSERPPLTLCTTRWGAKGRGEAGIPLGGRTESVYLVSGKTKHSNNLFSKVISIFPKQNLLGSQYVSGFCHIVRTQEGSLKITSWVFCFFFFHQDKLFPFISALVLRACLCFWRPPLQQPLLAKKPSHLCMLSHVGILMLQEVRLQSAELPCEKGNIWGTCVCLCGLFSSLLEGMSPSALSSKILLVETRYLETWRTLLYNIKY